MADPPVPACVFSPLHNLSDTSFTSALVHLLYLTIIYTKHFRFWSVSYQPSSPPDDTRFYASNVLSKLKQRRCWSMTRSKRPMTPRVAGFAAAGCDSAAELRHTAVTKKILRHAAGTLRHLLAELVRLGSFLPILQT